MLISYPGHHNHYPILFREAFNVTFIFSFPIHSWTWSSLAFILTTGLKWLFWRLLKASTWPNPMVSESPSWSTPFNFPPWNYSYFASGEPYFFYFIPISFLFFAVYASLPTSNHWSSSGSILGHYLPIYTPFRDDVIQFFSFNFPLQARNSHICITGSDLLSKFHTHVTTYLLNISM